MGIWTAFSRFCDREWCVELVTKQTEGAIGCVGPYTVHDLCCWNPKLLGDSCGEWEIFFALSFFFFSQNHFYHSVFFLRYSFLSLMCWAFYEKSTFILNFCFQVCLRTMLHHIDHIDEVFAAVFSVSVLFFAVRIYFSITFMWNIWN